MPSTPAWAATCLASTDAMFLRDSASKKTIENWVHQYSREFFAYAFFRLKKHEDAEDAVQTTFIKAYRSLHTYRPGSNQRAWLYAILGNTIKDTIRKDAAAALVTPFSTLESQEEGNVEDLFVDTKDTPDIVAAREIDYQRLADGIAALPEHFAAPLLMREVSDMSYKDIAEHLSVPIGTVMSRLSRARRALWEVLVGSGPGEGSSSGKGSGSGEGSSSGEGREKSSKKSNNRSVDARGDKNDAV